jgi:hypothetical protein
LGLTFLIETFFVDVESSFKELSPGLEIRSDRPYLYSSIPQLFKLNRVISLLINTCWKA